MSKRYFLYPLLPLYKLGVWVRNRLFDLKVLKSESFDIPVISIGNICVGGSGKTPHSEYFIDMLKDKYNIALLSRGYKRKSKGFILADDNSTAMNLFRLNRNLKILLLLLIPIDVMVLEIF